MQTGEEIQTNINLGKKDMLTRATVSKPKKNGMLFAYHNHFPRIFFCVLHSINSSLFAFRSMFFFLYNTMWFGVFNVGYDFSLRNSIHH